MTDHPTEQVDRVAPAAWAASSDQLCAYWADLSDHRKDFWRTVARAALDAATPPPEELPEYPFEVFLELLRDLEMSVRIPDNDKYQRTVARLNRPDVNDWLRDEDDAVGSVGERDQ